MKDKKNNKNYPLQKTGDKKENDLPGYPIYPASEDIYNKGQKQDNISLEDVSENVQTIENEMLKTNEEAGFNDAIIGNELDIPGSELDDAQENRGSEDEENNYYSLGGDNHNDLEEDNSTT